MARDAYCRHAGLVEMDVSERALLELFYEKLPN